MRDLIGLFVQQSLVGFIAAALLAGMVWFGSEYVGPGVHAARGLICVSIMAVWFVLFLVQRLQAIRRDDALRAGLDQQGEADQEHAVPSRRGEVEELQQSFDLALSTLRASKMGKRALTTLPWYVIIGPPASGKTTLLRESGLDFPSMNQSRRGIRGLGGTRNCDWWFNEHGILLDTAGRYTTEEEDRDEWLRFLSILKQGRKHNPINGAIVAFSVEDLIGASEQDLDDHAENIRERLDELTRQLDVVFPVYLLFTKCDRWPGFVQFFGDYSRAERAQVWGCTLPQTTTSADIGEVVRTEIERLYQRLTAVRLPILVDEPRQPSRDMIYQFPLQFAGLRDNVSGFVERIFRPNPYQESPLVRGFYFTSGTQEGAPMDHLLAQVRGALGLHADPSYGDAPVIEHKKAYFVDNLFTDVIFPDQELAHPSGRIDRQRRLAGIGVAAASVLALFTIGLLLNGSHAEAASVLSATGQAVTDVRQHGTPTDLVSHQALTRLARQLEELQADQGSWPFSVQARDFTLSLAQHYAAGIVRVYVVPAMARVETEIEKLEELGRPTRAGDAARRIARARDLLRAYDGLALAVRAEDAARSIDGFWVGVETTWNAPDFEPQRHARWYFENASSHPQILPPRKEHSGRLANAEIATCQVFLKDYDEQQRQELARVPAPEGVKVPPPRIFDVTAQTMADPELAGLFDLLQEVPEIDTLRARWQMKRGYRIEMRSKLLGVLEAKFTASRGGVQLHPDVLPDWSQARKDAEKELLDGAGNAWREYAGQIRFVPKGDLSGSIAALDRLRHQLPAVVRGLARQFGSDTGGGEWLPVVLDALRTLRAEFYEFDVGDLDRHLSANFDAFMNQNTGLLPLLQRNLVRFEKSMLNADRGRLRDGDRALFNLARRVSRSAVLAAVEALRGEFGRFAERDWTELVYEPLRTTAHVQPYNRNNTLETSIEDFQRLFAPNSAISTLIRRCRSLAETPLHSGRVVRLSARFPSFAERYSAIQGTFWHEGEFGLKLQLMIGRTGAYDDIELVIGEDRVGDLARNTRKDVFDATWRGSGVGFTMKRAFHQNTEPVVRTFAEHSLDKRRIDGPWGLFNLIEVGKINGLGVAPVDKPPGYTQLAFRFPPVPSSGSEPELVTLFCKVKGDASLLEDTVAAFFKLEVPESPVVRRSPK